LPADNSVFGAGNGSGRESQFFEVVAWLARVQGPHSAASRSLASPATGAA